MSDGVGTAPTAMTTPGLSFDAFMRLLRSEPHSLDAYFGEIAAGSALPSTLVPARALAQEGLSLERQLSDLVNIAYGLTSAEIELMWDTAPPRMPFTDDQSD